MSEKARHAPDGRKHHSSPAVQAEMIQIMDNPAKVDGGGAQTRGVGRKGIAENLGKRCFVGKAHIGRLPLRREVYNHLLP